MERVKMAIIALIHWNQREGAERAEMLRAAGYEVIFRLPDGQPWIREMHAKPPDVFVIDLTRLPAQGRDMAFALRENKKTREVPLIFVGGDPMKVARIKQMLADAVYTDWDAIIGVLVRVTAQKTKKAIAPASRMDGYAGTTLLKKLGIKEGMKVALIDAPEGFEKTIGELPEGVAIKTQSRGVCDLAIWFPRSKGDLLQRIEKISVTIGEGRLWIAWPKKAAGKATDLTQNVVRQIGLAAGLVDYKISSFDAVWSGLLFTKRKSR